MAAMRAPTQTIHTRNREFWTKFFSLYESLPALWDSRSPLYKIRAAKIAGYDILVEKLREIEPNADREDVLRKINIFRTNFRREISRINMSNKMGKQYKTTLWYFELLSFLKTQENRKSAQRNVRPDGEKCIMPKRRLTGLGSSSFVVKQSRSQSTNSAQESLEYEDEEITYGYDDENVNVPTESVISEHNTVNNMAKEKHFQREFQSFSVDRKIEPKLEPHEVHDFVDDIDDIMQMEDEEDVNTIQQECTAESENETGEWSENAEEATITTMEEKQHLHQNQYEPNVKTTSRESRRIRKSAQVQTQPPSHGTWKRYAASEASEILAKSWAVQYEEMSDDQKIYARKAIADILFEGCMGNLGRATVQQQQHQSEDIQQTAHENAVHVTGAVMVNGRSLLKQQQLTQQFHEVDNEFEECYVFDDGRAVKLQDWAAKMK